jgi:adenylate cyclase
MITLLILIPLPFFIALIALNYTTTSEAINKTSQEMVERFNGEIIKNLQQTLDPVITLTRSSAVLSESEPEFFKKDSSWELLRTQIEHSPAVFSAYIGFEDGSFRAVYRASEKTKFFGKASPDKAIFAYRNRRKDGNLPVRDQLTFIDADSKLIQRTPVNTDYDPRQRPWYQAAVEQRKSIVVGPIVFASNGEPGLTFATPVIVNDRVIAVHAMDITLTTIKDFLYSNRISNNSISLILDGQMRVIASSTQASGIEESELKRIPIIEQIADLNSQLPRQALLALPNSQFKGGFKFNSQEDGLSYMASLSDTRIKVATDWRVLVIAPSRDFLIDISHNNRLIAVIGSLTIVIQLLMIYWLARRIAKPLELLAHQVDNIQQLKFIHDQPLQRSSFSEIDHLSVSIDRMQKAIGAFAAFVPVDLVRGLMNSGKQLELGGRSRFLTIMFCDLESFSTLSESSPSQELLLRVSKYFEISTNAINEEFGTLDKFIGDGVMAFWGAPNTLDDHAYRACSAALKIQDQMHRMNQIWESQGLPPLKVRIGIHSDAVLVGNIGSLKRMSYTVMGDGVNVAARLEGINKELGTQICISKAVYREAGEKLNVRSLNEVTVKGRKSTIEIYELLGLKNSNLN